MSAPPRLRFAPAPTGYLHVGSARTALFNWLQARHAGGTLVLRIEDTDLERSRDDLVEGIVSALTWLGLDWDEGPYRQSERSSLYRAAAARFEAEGRAYRCDCTPEAVRERAKATGVAKPGYDGHCRDRGLLPGPGTVLRFRTPDEGETVVHDLIRGDVTFSHADLEDFVVLRSDGSPVFLVANAVDDLDMGITHVVRGEDILPSTPRALLLRRALGAEADPVFAHLPMIVNEKRQKLSKRRDDVALEDYRDRGYLPEAVRNYLALLGWGPSGDREVLAVEEMVAEFDVADVNKAPAFFDLKKLDSVNAEYLRALSPDEFAEAARPWLTERAPWAKERYDEGAFRALAPEVQTRVRTLAEVPNMVEFLFLDEDEFASYVDETAWQKVVALTTVKDLLANVAAAYEAVGEWAPEALKAATFAVGERHGVNRKKTDLPVRVAVTGRSVGPPLFESLAVLGRERTLSRLRAARRRLE